MKTTRKNRKRAIRFLAFMAVFMIAVNLDAVNLGVIAGKTSKPSQSFWGLNGQMGLIVPTLKLEIEWMHYNADEVLNALMAGIMFRPKLGKLSPYGVLGVGSEFDTVSLKFSRYNSFAFFGFGCHLFLMEVMSLRVDCRFLNFSERKRFSLSAGLFVHL